MSQNNIDSNIKLWLQQIGWGEWSLEVASADASFRSYYRLRKDSETYVLMDSSLLLESLTPFVEMQERLLSVEVQVPRIIVRNMTLGYMILEDFGNRHYFDVLNQENYTTLYREAIDQIVKMQNTNVEGLPLYDAEFLHFEMELMQEWYLDKYLQISITKEDEKILHHALTTITKLVLQQPQEVFVHRDFHSRNIMLTPKGSIGVIDFQDARVGAVTYDLVSLLKDCYLEWDKDEVEKLALYYRDVTGLGVDDATFIKWFDFMGLQRHIKVLGIFARLHLRDGKDGYLKEIPLTLKYVVETAFKYQETQALAKVLTRIQKDKK
ncbi:MAG: phosphotransferase [Campylobacterota bacterium]|nr:phosphotransferase [Campylobacterota bacterium]